MLVDAGIGTQAKVGAEDIAVDGALLEDVDEPLGQPDEEDRRRIGVRDVRYLAVVEHDQVDVARIVELAGAELAHAEDDEAGAAVGSGWVGELDLAGGVRLAEQEAHRSADGRIGEVGERLRHLDHVPDAAKIGERDEECASCRAASEPPHQLRFVSLLAMPRRSLATSRARLSAGGARSRSIARAVSSRISERRKGEHRRRSPRKLPSSFPPLRSSSNAG